MPMTHANATLLLPTGDSAPALVAPRRTRRAPRPSMFARTVGGLLILAAVAVTADASAAQQSVSADSAGTAARAQLRRQADSLAAAGNAAGAAAVRQRLTDGDFRPGDRILLNVTGNFVFNDTVAVREGQVVTVGTLPDIPLHGVLRAELNGYMTQQLSRFVKDPEVRAQALTRLAVLGAVGRPGYYALPADILLGDAIMHAGGPAANADVANTIVRRGKKEVLSKQQVQRAITEGKTLDKMDLRAGDEIVVAEKKQRNLVGLIYAATGLVGLALTLFTLAHR